MALKIKSEIENIKGLSKHIELVLKSIEIQKNTKPLSEFLCKKTLEKINEVLEQRKYLLQTPDGNENIEYLNEYMSNHNQTIYDNGFEITNNTMADYDKYPFSIALAFEFGVGIVGEGNPVQGAWEYNINKYNFGWTYRNKNGEKIHTWGHGGAEIYRYTKIELERNVTKWIMEYYKNVKV